MKVIAGMMVRGEGSTLPRKNAHPILGKPMIRWALEAVKKCDWIDDTWVWTEDQELKEIAIQCGCHVIDRTREQIYYHGDTSNPLKWKEDRELKVLEKFGTLGDIRVSLNCNLCLITPEILTEMYRKLMEDPWAGEIVPVCRVAPNLFTENPVNGKLFPIWNQFGLDRQDYPPLFRAGGIRISHAKRYESKVSLQTAYHEVEAKYLLDVHDLEDVELAEFYLAKRPQQKRWFYDPSKVSPEEIKLFSEGKTGGAVKGGWEKLR